MPLFFQAGDGEALYTEICEMVEEMKKQRGNVVELEVTGGHAPHDLILVGDKVGFEVEAEEGVARAARWTGEVAK